MWNFLGQNWGNLASVAGLVFSFLAFVFSKRASRAAEEARELTLSRSLGEDMNNASKVASDIAAYVRSEKSDMALVRLLELIHQTSYIISRWDAKLGESSKNRLIKTREQLHAVHDLLSKSDLAAASPRDRAALARFCREVPTVFVEEYGIVVRTVDRQD